MGSNQHDPVSALREEDATGEVAVLFEDIRATMQLPMLTSIWRILASSPDTLRTTWQLTKPLFKTGYPEAILHEMQAGPSPTPLPLVQGQLEASGVTAEEAQTIRTIIEAYTRSNTLNMIALTALVVEPAGLRPEPVPLKNSMRWGPLPTVLAESDMAQSTWSLVNALNTFGATPDEPGLATLWRHLAYWPGFLAVVHASYAPLEQNETIRQSIQKLLEQIHSAGQQLAHHRPSPPLSPTTSTMIAKYVQHPGLVARMVMLGHSLSSWLRATPTLNNAS